MRPHKFTMGLVKPMIINGVEIREICRILLIANVKPFAFYERVSMHHASSSAVRDSIWGIRGVCKGDSSETMRWYPAPIEVLNAPLIWDLSMLDMAKTMAYISDAEAEIHIYTKKSDFLRDTTASDLETLFNKLQGITGIPTNELRHLVDM